MNKKISIIAIVLAIMIILLLIIGLDFLPIYDPDEIVWGAGSTTWMIDYEKSSTPFPISQVKEGMENIMPDGYYFQHSLIPPDKISERINHPEHEGHPITNYTYFLKMSPAPSGVMDNVGNVHALFESDEIKLMLEDISGVTKVTFRGQGVE